MTSIRRHINVIKQAIPDWFSRNNLRYFGCRVPTQGVMQSERGTTFISSEQYYGENRRYTLRQFMPATATTEATVNTIGDFQQYATLKETKQAQVLWHAQSKEQSNV